MWQCGPPPAALGQLEEVLRQILDVQRAQLEVQQAHLSLVQQQHDARSRPEVQAIGANILEVQPSRWRSGPLEIQEGGGLDSPVPDDERPPAAPAGAGESSLSSACAAAKDSSFPRSPSPMSADEAQSPSLLDDEAVEWNGAQRTESMCAQPDASSNARSTEILEHLNIINAYKALCKAIWVSNERPDAEIYDRLQSVPRVVRRLMFFTGVIPIRTHSGKTGFYSMYTRKLQYIVWAVAVAWTAQWLLLTYFHWDGTGSLSSAFVPCFCLCCQVATAPYMMIWRSEFGNDSQTLALLCSLDHVEWTELDAPTGVTLLLVLFYCASMFGVRVRYTLNMWDPGFGTWRENATAMDKLLVVISLFGLPALVWWIATVFGLAWLNTFGSKLHRFDLLKYATTLERAIVSNEANPELLEMITKYEATVTARLRHASRRWVRYGLFLIFMNTAAGMIICCYLVSDQPATSDKLSCFVVLTAILAWNSMVTRSFAQVAETFDYDVLRSLNNPVVLSCVQKYMGQQFLTHMSFLDWGFRIGGTVISTRLGVQISIPLVAGLLSALAKLILVTD